MDTGRDQSGEMRHVDHEVRADLVGDRAETGEVDDPRVGRAAGDDDFRLVLERQPLDLVEVDQGIVAPDAVLNGMQPLAGDRRRRPVREVAAGGERHAQQRFARLHQREIDGAVGLRAGVRLHIGEFAAEQLLRPLDGERLGDVDELAAAVVAPAGIAFGILVGHHRALRLEHRPRDDVFRGDQLDVILLPPQFLADGGGDVRVGFRQRRFEEAAVVTGRRGLECVSHSMLRQKLEGVRQLFDTTAMMATLELGREEHPQALARDFRADHPAAEANDVCIVMLTRKPGPERIVHQRGPHLGISIGGDADADTAATDQYPLADSAFPQRTRHGVAEIGIVDRLDAVDPEIDDDPIHRTRARS